MYAELHTLLCFLELRRAFGLSSCLCPLSFEIIIIHTLISRVVGNSITLYKQDMFGIIPGDTDYRIFAEDYGNIPGLDIIFVLGGYFYHTSYDTVERLLYASIIVY